MSDQTVKVAVRVRPLVKSENARGCQNIIQKTPSLPQICVESGNKNDAYTFNYVFAPEDTQEMVYENAVKSMVLNLFQGLHLNPMFRRSTTIRTILYSVFFFSILFIRQVTM